MSAQTQTTQSTESTQPTVVAQVAEPVAQVAEPVVEAVVEEAGSKKARRVVDSSSVVQSFDSLLALVEAHINGLRASTATSKSGNTGIKFLRSTASKIKQLKKDATRVMDTPKKRVRSTTATKGGFIAPHPVTPAMADFAGWEANALKSRVDITKAICGYIKDNKLNDPVQRKNILPDEKLRNLLDYDPTQAGKEPLTYFFLQKLINRLQVKTPAPVAQTA